MVQQHLGEFLAHVEAGEQAGRLPAFVKDEFEAYLACGLLARGCVQVRCERCGEDMVVAFSCKGVIVFAILYVFILNQEQIRSGGRAMIASTRALPVQCLDPKIKSLSRLHVDLAMLQGKAAGMDVSIMLDLDGHVTEGPGFNVFVVEGGELFSPPEGATRGCAGRRPSRSRSGSEC